MYFPKRSRGLNGSLYGGAEFPLEPAPLSQQLPKDEKQHYVPRGEHIYYNLQIFGRPSLAADPFNPSASEPVLAQKLETYPQPLLQKADDWCLSVIRFKIPTSYIPIFNYDGSGIVNIVVGAGSAGAGSYAANVTLTPADATQPAAVFYVRDFVAAVNSTIRTAYNAAVVAGFGGSPGLPPFISYDGTTGLMTISYEQTWWSPDGDAGVNAGATASLFMNFPLFESYFDSFRCLYSQAPYTVNQDVKVLLYQPQFEPSAAGPLIVCQSGGLTSNGANPSVCTWSNAPVQHGLARFISPGNGVNDIVIISGASPAGFNGVFRVTSITNATSFTYTAAGVVAAGAATGTPSMVALPRGSQIPAQFNSITQETPSVASWDQFVSLRLVTTLVPVRQEWLPTVGSNGSNLGTRAVITDFNPTFSDQVDTRNYLQYFPQGEYRRIDLTSSEPLRSFDIQALWVDRLGQEHAIYIPDGESMDIKILFERKPHHGL